jgi:PQQ enzyme repeat.
MPADLGANVAVLGVRQAWTARIGSVAGLPLDVHSAGNVVTVASSDGVVAAIDARTGGDVWRVALSEPLSAGVGSDGKSAAVVSRSNTLIVLDAGRERWRQSLAAQVFTPPLVAGGRVFVLSPIVLWRHLMRCLAANSGVSSAPVSLWFRARRAFCWLLETPWLRGFPAVS